MTNPERSQTGESKPLETFVALLFPHRNASELVQLEGNPDIATYNHQPDGIIYDYHTDYRGITQALNIDDETYFEGAQSIYGRFLGADEDWAYVRPIQFTIAPDRRSAKQGYSQHILRIAVQDVIGGGMYMVGLTDEKLYKDLLSDRLPEYDTDYGIPPPFNAYSWPLALASRTPK